MAVVRGSLADTSVPEAGERFVALARLGDAVIEHIVSSPTPSTAVQDQAHDEWVLLVSGTAELDVDGERIVLAAGDWLLLPARTPHRVLATSDGARWIAVHGR